MPPRTVRLLMLLAVATSGLAALPAASATRSLRPARATTLDDLNRIDANHVSMVVKNTGSFAFDTPVGGAGLEFPKGSGKTAVFAAGLWVAATRSSSLRVSVSEYSDDFRPGNAPGGVAASPSDPAFKVYKLLRVYPDAGSRTLALAAWNSGALPYGAPSVSVLGDGTLNITGDQMLWSVYNDVAKVPGAQNGAGTALPLGIEVQQTTWAYDRPGPYGRTVFKKYRLINRGGTPLVGTHVGLWADPDLGGFNDDLVGCDSAAALGYCYNASNADQQYGTAPPAVGFDLLRGPAGAPVLPEQLSFSKYTNGTDPRDSLETYSLMQGLNADGSPKINPVTLGRTRFSVSGDPVTNQGWLDSSPSDRRLMLACGPFTIAPGAASEVTFAIMVGQGMDRLNSVSVLRETDAVIQASFDGSPLDSDAKRIDANQVSMVVQNTGSIALDHVLFTAGLEFPKGSAKTAVYAAGVWAAAKRTGDLRVSVSEYSDDFRPGGAPGGVAVPGGDPTAMVYKLQRVYPEPVVRDLALADWTAGAVPNGAPPVSLLGDGTLGIAGDQMLWSVYNDAAKIAGLHNSAGTALPLGIEVQQTTWAYDRPGPAGGTVFTTYRVLNRGASPLDSTYLGLWVDPDLGGASDDLVGCDTTTALGYCYNATNADLQYGSTPPAVGFDLLRGPSVGPVTLGLRAFNKYANGTDPSNPLQTWYLMRGLNADGSAKLNPVTLGPTRYSVSGDPVTSSGWLDTTPGDRRLMLTCGPFTMAPGEAKEATFAILLAQGTDRLNSVSVLRSSDAVIQTAFDANTLPLLAAPPVAHAQLSLSAPWPNPARRRWSVAFTTPSAGRVTLEVVDVTGRRVLERSLGEMPAGPHTSVFDAQASRLAAGVYFVKVLHAGGSASRRVVLLP